MFARLIDFPAKQFFLVLVGVFISQSLATAQQPANNKVEIRSEVYSVAPTETGQKKLGMDLYIPKKDSIKGAVILVHGGSFVTGSRDLEENQAYGKALAERGYLAAAISYRLHGDQPVVGGWVDEYARTVRQSTDTVVQTAIGQYGTEWADAVAASAQDLVAAIDWLRGHATQFGYDPDNIALFGASAGAISCLTVSYAIDNYGAEPVDITAVIDLRGFLLQPAESSLPIIEPGDPPLLMFHGDEDKRVPPAYADSLFEASQDAGLYVEYYSAPGFGHELGSTALLEMHTHVDEKVIDRIDDFLSASFSGSDNTVSSIRSHLVNTGKGPQTTAKKKINDADFRTEIHTVVKELVESTTEEPGFVESLYDISRRDLLLYEFNSPDRRDWSYWPRERAGLSLRHMTAEQRSLTHDVLYTILSSKGYLQAVHIMNLEEILADMETVGFSRGVENYRISVFGKPSDHGPWAFRFEGHHLSLNITVTPDTISVTPSFFGAVPAPISSGALAGFNPLKYEQQAAFDLLYSLDGDQSNAAVLSEEPPRDILSTQFQVERSDWDQWRTTLETDGISATALNPEQRSLLRRILIDVVGVYRDEISTEYLSNVDLDSLTFAWMGKSEIGKPHYFRIQGEYFIFELDAAQGDGTHVHTVWRDRNLDFGDGELLTEHYKDNEH